MYLRYCKKGVQPKESLIKKYYNAGITNTRAKAGGERAEREKGEGWLD